MTQTLSGARGPAPVAALPLDPPTLAGLQVPRRFTRTGVDPLDEVAWDRRRTVIANPDGSVVFQMDGVEVPADWSQLATDIVVSKYFRKAGLPGAPGHETSVRQVVHRIARTLRASGEQQGGYFAGPADADAFEAELAWMLVHQVGAFNSPVWFNCGLWHEYGIGGSGGNYCWDAETDTIRVTTDSYSRPQVSACFIQSVDDDLMSIFDLARNEARVFKYGSGTGTNFSRLRGRMERLSGGGTSSGLMSFLEVLDKGAGATKSGGTTRRAAKMVVLDADHPEILDFIRWKMREEKKVAALVAAGYSSDFNAEAYGTVSGQNSNNSVRLPDRFMQAVVDDLPWQTTYRTGGGAHETLRARDVWREIAAAAWQCADPGVQYDDTIQRWQKSPFVPSLLDSFQEADGYPGELYFYSLVDPAAPSLWERRNDSGWTLPARLGYARAACEALRHFHQPQDPDLAIVHRRTVELHSRYMAATVILLLPPALGRFLMFWVHGIESLPQAFNP